MKLMTFIQDIKDYFILTIIFFACICIVPCKKLNDRDIEKIMKRWLNEKNN